MARIFSRVLLVIALPFSFLGMPVHSHAQQSGKPSAGKSTAEGKQIFSTTCAACHGLDGGGGERGPDISHRREIQRLSDKALTQIVHDGVPGTRMPAFGSLGTASVQAVIRYLRSLQGQMAATPLTGDAGKGKSVFFGKGNCSQCHTANGQGGFMGSDLSSFASTQSPPEVKNAITEPNRNLDPRKRVVMVTAANGEILTGLARNEDNFSLQLQTTDGAFHLLNKAELQKIEYQPRSLMPDDYASRLSSKELDDLVSYLISIARDKNKPEVEQE